MIENMIQAIKDTTEDAIGFYGRGHVRKDRPLNMINQVQKEFEWVRDVDMVGQLEATVIENKKIKIGNQEYEAELLEKRHVGRKGYMGLISSEIYRLKDNKNLANHERNGDTLSYYDLYFKINKDDIILIRDHRGGDVHIDYLYYASDEAVQDGNMLLEGLSVNEY